MFGITSRISSMIFAGIATLLLVVCVYQQVQINGFLWIDGLRDKLADCERDRNELRAGVAEAKRLNEAQVQRIEKEQEAITNDIERKYEADRVRLKRELADRLRAKAPQGNPAGPKAGPNGPAPSGPDEAAKVCIPTGDYVSGAETELQLDTLITWVEQQLKVVR
jgi:hypothetical protein